jgi:ribosomal protein L2
MYIKKYKVFSPAIRFKRKFKIKIIRKFKCLSKCLISAAGHNISGHIVTRHKCNRKRPLIKFITNKTLIYLPGQLISLGKDPFRTANIGLIKYINGLYSYIIVPSGLKVGS